MKFDIKNKVVVITGASEGVGAAVAQLFATMKTNLVLIARNQQKLEQFAESLAIPERCLTITQDVSHPDACQNIIYTTLDRFGRIDILINNAGFHQRGPFQDLCHESIGQMVDVNLRAPLQLCFAVIDEFKKQKSGTIVNVGSLAGRTPLQGAATYAATKAGLRSFTYSLHDELSPLGIHVGVVSPGPIDTGFIMTNIDDVEDIVFSQKMSTASDVAQAVLAVVLDKKTEIVLPSSASWLTNLGYLLPWLRRSLRPVLYRKGRRIKDHYRKLQKNL